MSTLVISSSLIYVGAAFYTDIRWMIIPNKLVVPAAVLGMMVQTYCYQWNGMLQSFIGLTLTFSLTLCLYLLKAVGAGDVKGLAALGAITGAQFAIIVLIIAIFYAAIVGLVIIIFRGRLGEILKMWYSGLLCYYTSHEKKHLQVIATDRVHYFPFMLAVLPAVLTCLVLYE